jgi:hypothetical protein
MPVRMQRRQRSNAGQSVESPASSDGAGSTAPCTNATWNQNVTIDL